MNSQQSKNTMSEHGCDICGGLGYTVRRTESGELVSSTCKCEIIRQNRIRMERSGLFFIGGSPGTGKTHLCTAICAKLMDGGIPVRYVQWRGDIPAIKAKVNDAEAYAEAMHPLKTVRALYIDDFLKGSVTDADKNIAFDLLNARYIDPDAITIISTELTIDRILSWDEAIGSRINQRARDYMLNIGKKQNWRLK